MEEENLLEHVSNLIATVGIYIEEKDKPKNPFVKVIGDNVAEKNAYLNMKSCYEQLSKLIDE